MDYVVFRSGGKQYKAKVGDTITVDKLDFPKDSQVLLDQVLLSVSDQSTKIGKPLVTGAKVKAKVMDQKKGEKLRVSKFKAKSRYRRTIGFRPQISVLKIEQFIFAAKSPRTKAK